MNIPGETSNRATIGPSVVVKGEITGDEDILIEGSVEGTVNLSKNAVTVAQTGRVKANVTGVSINVEGEVTGDLVGTERVVVQRTGKVIGNITAPTISIAEGARVRGMIDSESATTEGTRAKTALRPQMQVEQTPTINRESLRTSKSNGVTPIELA